ncbi:hypothetical protein M5K25_027770 [Dendrobium thyrsiflorum]|uniref:HMG box domain-containing protein n=1 Tax=Dendrobium thyrsiflorum TaxID=117978 RepID=A0ABD0TUP2_DENTH
MVEREEYIYRRHHSNESSLATKKAPEKRKTGSRKAKDPNKPKRPPSAFFVFMDQFRKEFKEKNPENKLVSVVGKAGGNKWKSMSDVEKAPYVAKADKLKEEYQKKMRSYDASEVEKKNAAEDESSDKSKSEVSEEGAGSDEEVEKKNAAEDESSDKSKSEVSEEGAGSDEKTINRPLISHNRRPKQEEKKRRREEERKRRKRLPLDHRQSPPGHHLTPEFRWITTRRWSSVGPPLDVGLLPDHRLTPEFRRTTT